MADYLGLKLRHVDSTETGGSSLPRACRARRRRRSPPGKCSVALITLAGRPRAERLATRHRRPRKRRWLRARPDARARLRAALRPDHAEHVRHGAPRATCTSSAPPASSSPGSRWPRRTTRSTTRTRCCATWSRCEDVLDSPLVADPLHRLDCCVVSDGGGALVVARPEIARSLEAPAGQGARRRRGARSTAMGGTHRPDLLRRRAGPARRPSPRPA